MRGDVFLSYRKVSHLLLSIFFFVFFTTASYAQASKVLNISKVSSASKEAKLHQKELLNSIAKEKAKLNPNLKKLSTDLIQLIDEGFTVQGQLREEIKKTMQDLKQIRRVNSVNDRVYGSGDNDLVYVYIYLQPHKDTHIIDSYAQDVTDRDEENNLAVAWVPLKNLEALASLDEVRSIQSVLPPVCNTGSITSEGDAIHRTDQVRFLYNQNGAGLKIGVISDGVDHWTEARDQGDLPGNLNILSNTEGGDEGTAILEIVYDLAPGAELYFHDCRNNQVAFNRAVDNLVAAGCKVICDDIGYYDEPCFEDGIIGKHIASVLTQNNIVYISSAGNDANSHYQGLFYDDGYGFNDFSTGTSAYKYLYLNIPPGGSVDAFLQWNDKFGSSSNDYDLSLWNYDTYEQPLAVSTNTQNGHGDPFEFITYTNNTGGTIIGEIDVFKYSGATKMLELYIFTDNGASMYADNLKAEDSIFGHPMVPGIVAAGAINSQNLNKITSYSSQGPATICFPSAELRNKPDVCGIDGVQITGSGNFSSPFYGTSAAAPHIAAITALVWAQYPNKSSSEIRNLILSGAVDLGIPGFDYIYGYGRADALNSIQKGDTIPPVYQSAAVSNSNHTVTLTFSENLVANSGNLKEAVTFAADGTNFNPLGASDTVAISNNTLVVNFNTPLTGNKNKICIAANALKDLSNNILAAAVITEPITAQKFDDMNIDGTINILDLLWMAQFIGSNPMDPIWTTAQKADVNEDGAINILDLLMVAQYIGS